MAMVDAGVYGGGPLYVGGLPVIDDLRASGFTTITAWTLHVSLTDDPANNHYKGDLVFNDQTIVSRSEYVGSGAWPAQLAYLKTIPTSVRRLVFCVGSGGTTDFANIQTLIGESGTGPDSLLYKNFKALLTAIPAIDAIDFDDEDLMDVDTTVSFAKMLGSLGVKVTFCPYIDPGGYWVPCLKTLEADDPGLVTRFNLQCYDGGGDNTPQEWMDAITAELGATFDAKGFVAPGLWCTNEAKPEWGRTPDAIRDQIANWRIAAVLCS